MVLFLFNTKIYVFLLLCLCILIVCIFIAPAGTLRLPWLRFFRAFSSIVRQISGYNSQRRDTARTLPKIIVLFYILFVLCCSVYCLCVNVYCTTATGWQPNCSSTNISYHKLFWIISADFCTQKSFGLSEYSLHTHIKFRSKVDGFPAKQMVEESFK